MSKQDTHMSQTTTRRNAFELHGMYGSPEYRAWASMRTRCRPKCASRRLYYDKGIKVCQRWSDSFVAFYEDVGARPSPRHTLDRIDSNGNYEPGNVRWATWTVQARNQWLARIKVDRKQIDLGSFYDKDDAILMRLSAEEQLWDER